MKKGFTLIELLAVIVILAIIALIITPVVQDIISSAKDSANKRSVEGHVKNVEYAIVGEAFNNGKENNYYDCVSGTDTVDTLTIPDSDKITCESYTIAAGMVEKALQCTDNVKNWGKKYDYIKGKGVIAASDNTNMFEYVDLSSSSNSSYGSNSNSELALTPGSYFVVLSYANATTDTKTGVNSDRTFNGIKLNTNGASCSVVDQKGYDVSGTDAINGIYQKLGSSTEIYRCNVNNNTTISYTSNIGSNANPEGVTLSAIKVSANENFTAVTSGGYGAGSYNGVAGPVLTNGQGQTIYGGRYLANVIPIYFNVTTGEKCDSSAWTANNALNAEVMKTGCLRFFAYMEDNLSYTMILDRNTTIWSLWRGNEYQTNALQQLKIDTNSWVNTITPSNYKNIYLSEGNELSYEIKYSDEEYKARLITTGEVSHIAGNANFNAYNATADDWYYLDGLTSVSTGATWQTQIATASEPSAYKWMFDYTKGCTNYGCTTTAAINTQGYWTSDVVSGNYNYFPVWAITSNGRLEAGNGVSSRPNGVRPVITVLKSILD